MAYKGSNSNNQSYGRHKPTAERPYFVSDKDMDQYKNVFQELLSKGTPRDAAISAVNRLIYDSFQGKSGSSSSSGSMGGGGSSGGSGENSSHSSQSNSHSRSSKSSGSTSKAGKGRSRSKTYSPDSNSSPFGPGNYSGPNGMRGGGLPDPRSNHGGSIFRSSNSHGPNNGCPPVSGFRYVSSDSYGPSWDHSYQNDTHSAQPGDTFDSYGSPSPSSGFDPNPNGGGNTNTHGHSVPGETNRAGWYTHGPPNSANIPLDARAERTVQEMMYVHNWSREKAEARVREDLEQRQTSRLESRFQRSPITPSSSSSGYRGGSAREEIVEALRVVNGYSRRDAEAKINAADIEADEEMSYRKHNESRYRRPASPVYGPYEESCSRFGSPSSTPAGLSRQAREEIRSSLRKQYPYDEVERMIRNYDKYEDKYCSSGY